MECSRATSKHSYGSRSEPPDFYIDAGLGGRAIPELVRSLGCKAYYKTELYGPRKVPDTEWMAHCDDRGLVVLTKDDKIRRREFERVVLSRSQLRIFCLSNGNLTKAEQVKRFEQNWQAILRRCADLSLSRPYMFGVHSDRLERMRLFG